MPLFRTLQWSWFVVAIFYTYGDFLHEFVLQHRALLWLSHITMFNAWLSFIAYCCVFVVSVLTLKKGLYKYQACDGGMPSGRVSRKWSSGIAEKAGKAGFSFFGRYSVVYGYVLQLCFFSKHLSCMFTG